MNGTQTGIDVAQWEEMRRERTAQLQRALDWKAARATPNHGFRRPRDLSKSPVACVEKRVVFRNIAAAARYVGLRSRNAIASILDNPGRTCCGCHWERYDRARHANWTLVETAKAARGA